MPGQSGLELLKKIRDARPALPVIVMTAHSDLGNAVSAYEGGAFEYLPKPFDIDQAVDLVRRAARVQPGGSGGAGRRSEDSRAARPGASDAAGVPRDRSTRAIQRHGADHAANRVPARSSSRAPSRSQPARGEAVHRAQHVGDSGGPARSPSCSVTRRARSPARIRSGAAASSRPTAARCSSTRSATCRRRCRRACCACSPKASSIASAARRRFGWTCA